MLERLNPIQVAWTFIGSLLIFAITASWYVWAKGKFHFAPSIVVYAIDTHTVYAATTVDVGTSSREDEALTGSSLSLNFQVPTNL